MSLLQKMKSVGMKGSARLATHGFPDDAFQEDGGLTDDQIVAFHKRIELQLPVCIFLAAGIAALLPNVGGKVSEALMPTVAQILPVLFLAQIVEEGFHAQRLARELGSDHQDLSRRYQQGSNAVCFLMFMAGETAAVIATAKGPASWSVVLALLVGIYQAFDLSYSPLIRSGGVPLSLKRMVDLQEDQKAFKRRQLAGEPPD
jgi:hypothetical protein